MIKTLLPAVFLLAGITMTPAQSSLEQSIIKARDQFSDIKSRSIEIEKMKRDANKRPANEDSAPKFPLIKEDFEQIQKLNDNIVRVTAAKSPENLGTVLRSVSEINHRAVRLKSNLFSVESKQRKEPKNKRQNAADFREIKELLDNLDKSINSFVHSSIFQNLKVVNSTDSLKAQKDLETVINVTNAIKIKTNN